MRASRREFIAALVSTPLAAEEPPTNRLIGSDTGTGPVEQLTASDIHRFLDAGPVHFRVSSATDYVFTAQRADFKDGNDWRFGRQPS